MEKREIGDTGGDELLSHVGWGSVVVLFSPLSSWMTRRVLKKEQADQRHG